MHKLLLSLSLSHTLSSVSLTQTHMNDTLSFSRTHTHTYSHAHNTLSYTYRHTRARTHTHQPTRHRNQIMNRQQLYSPVKLKTVGTETQTHLKVIKLYKRLFFLVIKNTIFSPNSFYMYLNLAAQRAHNVSFPSFSFSQQQSQKQKSQTVASCQDCLLKFYSQRKLHLFKIPS